MNLIVNKLLTTCNAFCKSLHSLTWMRIFELRISIFFFLLYRLCYFTSDSVHNKVKFMQQLNQSFGSGGMSCAFDSNHLVEYFQYLKRIVNISIPVKKRYRSTGEQQNMGA